MPEELPFSMQIGGWMLVAACLIGAVSGSLRIITWFGDRNKETPDPIATYATKIEVKHIEKRVGQIETSVEGLRRELRQDKDDLIQAGSQRVKDVYNKVDEVRRELKTDIEGVHARTTQILQSVSELKGKVESK